MNTELSDLCAEKFLEEVLFLFQKITFLVFVVFSRPVVLPSQLC